MGYIKTNYGSVGAEVILTEEKRSMVGFFEKGTKVIITELDPVRGYSFEDEYGNRVIEAGFTGFKEIKQ